MHMAIWNEVDTRPEPKVRHASGPMPWQERPFAWLMVGWGFFALVLAAVFATL
jgi:hypothetical protein